MRRGVAAVLAMMVIQAMPAAAERVPYPEWSLVERANRERVARGLSELTVAYDIVLAARAHAGRMRDAQAAYHDPALGRGLCCLDWVGENIGVGSDVGKIHEAFMRSPSHRAVMLDRRWNVIGVGFVIEGDRRIWVSQIFGARVRPARTATPPPTPAIVEPDPPARPPAAPARLRSVDLLLRMLADA